MAKHDGGQTMSTALCFASILGENGIGSCFLYKTRVSGFSLPRSAFVRLIEADWRAIAVAAMTKASDSESSRGFYG